MISRLALVPDLTECLLEERMLLYAGPGVYGSQFLPSSGGTPSLIVSGFSNTSSSGPSASVSTNAGPQFFFVQIGVNTTSNGGIRAGGTLVVYTATPLQAGAQATTGSTSSNGSGGANGPSAGYGGAVSSGYNTSLNASNNFGMGTTAVGSVTAHVSGTTDGVVQAQNAGASTAAGATNSTDDQNSAMASPQPSMSGPMQGGIMTPLDRLMGKGLGSSSGLIKGPTTGIGAGSP